MSAIQWSRALALRRGHGTARDELAPPWVQTLRAWWQQIAGGPHVLDAHQTSLLWREIVTQSREAEALIDTHAAADWAGAAAALLSEHRIDLEGVDATLESRALGGWLRSYRDLLERRRWYDASSLLERISIFGVNAEPSAVTLLDWADPSPLERRCFERLVTEGWRLQPEAAPRHSGRAQCFRAPNAAAEIGHAVEWCVARAAAQHGALVALVIPRGYASTELVTRLLGAESKTTFALGPSARDIPAVAAAFNALRLLSADGGALELSHWLRSPFFQRRDTGDAGTAARLEARLRGQLVSQLPFVTAFARGGLAATIEAQAPGVGTRLARALGRIGRPNRTASPGAWTEVWRACLRDLAWLADQPASFGTATRALDIVFADLAKLTAIVEKMSMGRALDELARLLDEPRPTPRMPLAGVHVLEHIDDVGPGYAAVWAVGFSDGAWPERRLPNPLLPRAVQARCGLPWSSPEDALARSQRSIARVSLVAPDVVLSWAAHDLEGPCLPSPLIGGLAALEPTKPATRADRRIAGDWIIADDPAPALERRLVPGGAATLNQHARCPLRAFVERRLGARPLTAWTRGVSPRLRGIIGHAAADALMPPGTTRHEILSQGSRQREQRIVAAIDSALGRAFAELREPLEALYMLERERLTQLLERLLDAESRREDFEILATESDVILAVGGYEIRARLDRRDRLADGGQAILDYKTGMTATPDWLGEEIRDVQVPLYATEVGSSLTAAVLCCLTPEGTRYRGFWRDERAFPDTPLKLPAAWTWSRVLAHWSSEIERLVTEFGRGDIRLRVGDTTDAEGLLAPLTRVYEIGSAHHELPR